MFFYDLDNFYLPVERGQNAKTPFYHPIRLGDTIVANAFIIVVPIGYYRIYSFLQDHNLQLQGEISFFYSFVICKIGQFYNLLAGQKPQLCK